MCSTGGMFSNGSHGLLCQHPVLQAPGPVSAIQLHPAGHAQTPSSDLQGTMSLQTHCVSLIHQTLSPSVGKGTREILPKKLQFLFVSPPNSLWIFIFKCLISVFCFLCEYVDFRWEGNGHISPPPSLGEFCPWPRWGIHSFMFRGQENCGGGGRAKGLLPARSSNFFLYI